MKQNIKRAVAFMFALAFVLTGMQLTKAQAAAKPVISSSQVAIKGSSCTIAKGRKVKLAAKSGKTNVTKKCAWKSSKKAVAAVSSKGVLTAKKAGTAYITATYKKKTSKRLKVAVIDQTANTPEPTDPSDTDTEPEQPSVQGAHTITYNVNSENKSDKLSGSSRQYVSGEILKFNATVNPASGHKFLGWYDAPTGGNRIYETYRPSKNMTLYAHYTDKSVQKVTFSLGCNYGNTNDFMGYDGGGQTFDWESKKYSYSPISFSSPDNVTWQHNYVVENKSKYTIDDLPEPHIDGYTFVGWYTTEQGLGYSANDGIRVENGQKIDVTVTRLYARFSRKLTISFDDLHGGKYDDIVIDTYTSIKDAGYKLPVLDIPGTSFLGWSLTSDIGHGYDNSVTEDSVFANVIPYTGYLCSEDDAVFIHSRDADYHWDTNCLNPGAHNPWSIFWDTDHITLYPVYNKSNVLLGFDPNGGYFTSSDSVNHPNYGLAIYKEDKADFKAGIGYKVSTSESAYLRADEPYGGPVYFPGHEGQGYWSSGNREASMPQVRRANYEFDKWVYLDENGDEKEFTFDTILTKNMTVYAKWVSGACIVAYDATDGKITAEERNRVGLSVVLSYKVTAESSIAKDGKQMPVPVSTKDREFLGWYTLDGKEFTKDMAVSEDIVLFAKWGE